MRPVIGIPLRYQHLSDNRCITYMAESVRRTIVGAGGEVFAIAPVQDVDYIDTKGNEFRKLSVEEKLIINKNLDRCDGLFLPGGIKFTPYDRYLLEQAIKRKIPTLGVCLSMQMMSCYLEDIKLEANQSNINHFQDDDNILTHKVYIDKESKLYEILGKEEIMVNSYHKYHANENHFYKTVAVSEDNLIEAIEYPGNFFNIGVQWHPEISYSFDDNSRKIISSFISEAKMYNKKKTHKEEKSKQRKEYVAP